MIERIMKCLPALIGFCATQTLAGIEIWRKEEEVSRKGMKREKKDKVYNNK